ncbi:MAG TPA: hypothetical protein VGG51_03535 [Candidatus Cybelea sp.]|jgi:hypothetical protein
MIPPHHHHPELIRLTMGLAMAATGVAALRWPRCFAGIAGTFTCWAEMGDAQRERLDRVVAAREQAEGVSRNYGRALGVSAFALAALEAVPSVPFVLPYALFCLAGSAVALLAYLQFRRATEQRVAPLIRRSPFSALPPLLIACIAASFIVAVLFAIEPQNRIGAIVVAASTLVLGFVAWRIAAAPALLLGVDPQYEYALDERLRLGRARNVAVLACAPVLVFSALSEPGLPEQYGLFGTVAMAILIAAFVVALAASILPHFGRVRVA